MPDVQGSRTLRKPACEAGAHAVKIYRFTLKNFLLVVLLGLAATVFATQARADTVREDSHIELLHRYIGDKYKVPKPAVKTVVSAAWDVGGAMKLDPLLLLAVMAIESSFDPKAQSHKGAQGLMQVMTRIHHKKFEPFGGTKAAFRPDANIEVGAQILKECIARRGSIAGGLTCYVGSPGTRSKYGNKVLAELDRLKAAIGAKPPASKPAPVMVAANETGTAQAATEDETTKAIDEAAKTLSNPPVSRMVEGDAQRLASNEVNDVTVRGGLTLGM